MPVSTTLRWQLSASNESMVLLPPLAFNLWPSSHTCIRIKPSKASACWHLNNHLLSLYAVVNSICYVCPADASARWHLLAAPCSNKQQRYLCVMLCLQHVRKELWCSASTGLSPYIYTGRVPCAHEEQTSVRPHAGSNLGKQAKHNPSAFSPGSGVAAHQQITAAS